jgi:inner membrane protein
MTLPLIGLLNGISPLWWLAAGLVLLGLEAVTVTTHLIWPALAALGVAILLWLFPGISGIAQLGLFAALTIALIPVGRTLLERLGSGDGSKRLNRRADQLVGREAVVETFHWHEGQVNIDGVIWPARLDGRKTPEVGEHVRVIAADGIVVWVRRLPGAQKVGDRQELS